MIKLIALQLGVLYVFFKDGYKIMDKKTQNF